MNVLNKLMKMKGLCKLKISDNRLNLFKKFWGLPEHIKQADSLLKYVIIAEKKHLHSK